MQLRIYAETQVSFEIEVGDEPCAFLRLDGGAWYLTTKDGDRWIGQARVEWDEALRRACAHLVGVARSRV